MNAIRQLPVKAVRPLAPSAPSARRPSRAGARGGTSERSPRKSAPHPTVGLAAPSNWRLLNGGGPPPTEESNSMAATGSSRVRSRPWWRRVGADRRATGSARGPRAHDAAELAIVCRAQRGGPREREELVNAYLPMIASVARAYRRSTAVGRDELTQEGVVGLLRALERYDPDRGVPFWGYAAWWVRQAMQQVVSELSGPMVLSDRALRQLARVKDAQRRFEQARRREATSAELSAIVGMPRSQIESLLRTERTARGLDEPAGAEARDGATVGDLLADPPAQEAYERRAAAGAGRAGARAARPPDPARANRHLLPLRPRRRERTLREVAPDLGVSAERVRQIEQESLAKLGAAVARQRAAAGERARPAGGVMQRLEHRRHSASRPLDLGSEAPTCGRGAAKRLRRARRTSCWNRSQRRRRDAQRSLDELARRRAVMSRLERIGREPVPARAKRCRSATSSRG